MLARSTLSRLKVVVLVYTKDMLALVSTLNDGEKEVKR